MASKWKLSALYAALESTFGTDPSADGSGYKFIKVLPDASWQPHADVIERPGLVKDLTTQQHAMGPKGGTLTFKMEVKGSGTAAVDAVAAIAAESDPILQSYFGAVTRQTGDTIQGSASTTTVLNVSAGTRFAKYGMIRVLVGSTYHIRFITAINTNALTIDRALPSAPATSAVVQGSSRYTRANTGHQSLAFVAQRHGIEHMFNGCKVDSLKLTGITARGTAIIEVVVSASDWSVTSKSSLPTAALTGITAVRAPVLKGAGFAIGGTEEYVYSAEFDPQVKSEFQDSTQGINVAGVSGFAGGDGVNAGFEVVDSAPKGTVKPYHAAGHLTDFLAGTTKTLALAAAKDTTTASDASGWGLYVPVAQWGQPAMEDHLGMVGEGLPFMVRDNSTDPEFSLCLF